jgi:hypothetical protein
MKSKLEDPFIYSAFMRSNEKRLREKLNSASSSQCIEELHNYAGVVHNGIIAKDLTEIEMAYESIQTILEIYYEKLK